MIFRFFEYFQEVRSKARVVEIFSYESRHYHIFGEKSSIGVA